jgi:hypothetical protein
MTSKIDISKIDVTYPLAGKDNSTQGFRDNFENIVIALSTASMEISSLQLTGVKLNSPNDFSFVGTMARTSLQNSGLTAVNIAPITGIINYSSGSYQKSAITTSTTFQVINWPPTGIYSKLILEVTPATTSTINITFNAGSGVLKKESATILPYVSAGNSSTFWELWTSDAGATVFLKPNGGSFS